MASTTKNTTANYLVGIDLGTTHCVVSFIDIDQASDPSAQAQLFPIEQLVGPGEIAAKPLLPSFRYHPAQDEIDAKDCVLPWHAQAQNKNQTLHTALPGEIDGPVIIGSWARELGSKTQGRLVSSAKSWLCHDKVDRSADILPWDAPEEVRKISPVHASASYLHHIRCAWDYHFKNAPLHQQDIVITVPASFDEAARALTLEATQWAGLPKVLLVEEPQAVFYDWFHRHKDNAKSLLKHSQLILVCDVGGGTTDLSLITVSHKNNELTLNRVGVGDHLLLGGDNVDLALAKIAEGRITGSDGTQLSVAALTQLVQQTRQAKELLLSEQAPATAKVTVLGSGSKLIGGARSAELNQEEVFAITLDGFFPLSNFEGSATKKRLAMVEFGLPFANDPAISHHLADFIRAHQNVSKQALGDNQQTADAGFAIADTLLLNGGVFNSKHVTQRVCELIASWSGKDPLVLDNGHPDLAVAFGAVAYAKSKQNKSLKIGGGSARAFFLRVEADKDSKAICLLAKGAEEEIEHRLSSQTFALKVGEPVQFHLYSYSADNNFQPGDLTDINENFRSLPPLVTALDKKSVADNSNGDIQVQLLTKLTEVGTIALEAVAVSNFDKSSDAKAPRWLIEFEIRSNFSHRSTSGELPENYTQAQQLLLDIFGSSKKQVAPKTLKSCRSELERLLGKRDTWETHLLRELANLLLENQKRRRRSEQHERLWNNLMGFCLRPGYGFPLDDWRMEQITRLYNSGLQFDKSNQSWAEWWTLWRRIAGGLRSELQLTIAKDIGKFINPASARNSKVTAEIKNKSYEDMLRLIACLEYLPAEKKQEIGSWCSKRLSKSSETPTCWWSLGRIAAREPLYGSAHAVVASSLAEQWLNQSLDADWKKNDSAMLAAVLMSKMSGDRSRDISLDLRNRIILKLREHKAPDSWIEMVSRVSAIEDKDQKKIYGDSLPTGIRIIN